MNLNYILVEKIKHIYFLLTVSKVLKKRRKFKEKGKKQDKKKTDKYVLIIKNILLFYLLF